MLESTRGGSLPVSVARLFMFHGRNEPLGWQTFHGVKIPSPASVTWLDEGTASSVWTIEDVAYNVDVAEYIRARGY